MEVSVEMLDKFYDDLVINRKVFLISPDVREVSDRLEQVRLSCGFSFFEFGELIGVDEELIRDYCDSSSESLIPINFLEKLSKIFNKPIGWYYYGNFENYIAKVLDLYNLEVKDDSDLRVVGKLLFILG